MSNDFSAESLKHQKKNDSRQHLNLKVQGHDVDDKVGIFKANSCWAALRSIAALDVLGKWLGKFPFL